MKYLIVLVLCFVCAVNCDDSVIKTLPSYVVLCSRADPKLDDCIRKNLQTLLSRSKAGFPTYGIESFDPYTLDNTTFTVKQRELQGRIQLKNAKSIGISEATIKNFRLKIEKSKVIVDLQVLLPRNFIEGTYKGNFLMNNEKLSAKGYLNLTMINFDSTIQLKGNIVQRDGKEYLHFDAIDYDTTIKDLKFFATGLVPDPTLNDLIVEVVNAGWPTTYKIVVSESKKDWSPVVLAQINAISDRIPLDIILKE